METQLEQASNFNPLALGMLVLFGYLVWSLPRRLAACPLLVMTYLMPLGQELVLFGLHLYLFRVLLLLGVVRVFVKGEARQLVLTRLDKLFGCWIAVSAVLGSLSNPSFDLLKNRMGEAYSAAGCYFFLRCVMVDFEDMVTSVCALAWVSLPMATLMLVEKKTGHNLFSVFGGVPEITTAREGHLRCQGAFRHPILAGTIGATQIPLFVGLWIYQRESRRLAAAATVSSLLIVVAASSSGALMALFAGIGGLVLWRWRGKMRLIRRGTVLAILAVSLVMNAPIWYLFARLGDVTGGTGWHRAWVIDQAVSHFDEWWLFGTTYTAHWGPGGQATYGDPNMMDITNHYVIQGVTGGLLKLLLFIAIIVASFKTIGRRLETEMEGSQAGPLIWAVGVCLFAHCLSFMSATYFDQTVVVWYWLLAAICCVGFTGRREGLQSKLESCGATAVA
jgi:hypothetical protein